MTFAFGGGDWPQPLQNRTTDAGLGVVEDDRAICEYISELLADFGFAVVCMTSDREAYARLPTLRGVAALVVDINLGAGTTGFDVARFARQLHPMSL